MGHELPIIQLWHTFTLELSQRVVQFPRPIRQALGVMMEHRAERILSHLLRARFSAMADRPEWLREVNHELEVLRFQLRQAEERRALSIGGHERLIKQLLEVGHQVGGWLRHSLGSQS